MPPPLLEVAALPLTVQLVMVSVPRCNAAAGKGPRSR
jgi:hypothetical protein